MNTIERRCGRNPLSLFALVAIFVLASAAAPAFAADGALAEGTWTKKSFSVAGEWKIVEDGGDRYVVLSDDFETKKAPDLKIFLSPRTTAEVGNDTAVPGSALVAPLESHKGGQKVKIPSDLDLSKYTSILIHCEKYTKLWAASDL